jgi:hypothetical protein
MSDGNNENQNDNSLKTPLRKRRRVMLVTVSVLLGVLLLQWAAFPRTGQYRQLIRNADRIVVQSYLITSQKNGVDFLEITDPAELAQLAESFRIIGLWLPLDELIANTFRLRVFGQQGTTDIVLRSSGTVVRDKGYLWHARISGQLMKTIKALTHKHGGSMPTLQEMLPHDYRSRLIYSSGEEENGAIGKTVWNEEKLVGYVPLAEDYYLCLIDKNQLSWTLARRVGEQTWVPLVKEVTQFGEQPPYFLGLTSEQYFLLKMAPLGLAEDRPTTAPSEEKILFFPQYEPWTDAIKEAGLPESAGKMAPLPVWTSQSEDSPPSSEDHKWAIILIAFTVTVGLVLSFRFDSLIRAVLVSMAWGAFLGFLSDMLIFEGGGGFLSYALCAAIAVLFGRLIRKGIKCVRSKPSAGQSQDKEDVSR